MTHHEVEVPDPPGHGTVIEATKARGGRGVGLIWMLGISTVLAVLALLAIWAVNSGRLHGASQDNPQPRAPTPAVSRTNTP